MSESEHFLSRWSRRKQEAKQPAHEEVRLPADAGTAIADEQSAKTLQSVVAVKPPADRSVVEHSLGKGEVEPFDPESLPPVGTIEATTDIRAFLNQNVPADLTKAALRQAWSSDPAIRDFVGLSENAWDFNAPDSIPGFGGALPADEVQRIVAHMTRSEPKAESTMISEAASGESISAAEGGVEAAQTSGNTSQGEKHALVNTGDESEPTVTVAEGGQHTTIENKTKDVAVQNINNHADLAEAAGQGNDPKVEGAA